MPCSGLACKIRGEHLDADGRDPALDQGPFPSPLSDKQCTSYAFLAYPGHAFPDGMVGGNNYWETGINELPRSMHDAIQGSIRLPQSSGFKWRPGRNDYVISTGRIEKEWNPEKINNVAYVKTCLNDPKDGITLWDVNQRVPYDVTTTRDAPPGDPTCARYQFVSYPQHWAGTGVLGSGPSLDDALQKSMANPESGGVLTYWANDKKYYQVRDRGPLTHWSDRGNISFTAMVKRCVVAKSGGRQFDAIPDGGFGDARMIPQDRPLRTAAAEMLASVTLNNLGTFTLEQMRVLKQEVTDRFAELSRSDVDKPIAEAILAQWQRLEDEAKRLEVLQMQENATRAHLEALALEKQRQEQETARLAALALEEQRQQQERAAQEQEAARLTALALERQRQQQQERTAREQEAARLAALALEEQRQQQQERAAREQEAADKARYDLEAAQYMAQLERERWAAQVQGAQDALEKEKATLLLADQAKAKQAETIKIAGAVVLVGLLILSRRR
jgi:hypothetical protein